MRREDTARASGAVVLLILLSGAGALAYRERDKLPLGAVQRWWGSEARPLPDVALAPPSAAADRGRVAALGRLQPKDGVRVIAGPAQAVAVVGELFVDEGDAVRAGQVIARLDEAELREAAVQRAEARLANADAELARNQRLRERRVISVSQHEKLQLERDVALAELRLARAELERVQVRAPFDGRVIDVHARAGERVGPEGILELGQTQAMYAVAEVYETAVGAVKLGADAEVRSPALPRPLRGRVDRVALRVRKQDVLGTDPAARTDARVVEVEIRLDAEDAPVAEPFTHLQVEVAIDRAARD